MPRTISKWHLFSINTDGWVQAGQTFKCSCLTCALCIQGWFTVFSAFTWPSALLAGCPGTTSSYPFPWTYGCSAERGQLPPQGERQWGKGIGNSEKFSSVFPSTLSLCSCREREKTRLNKYRQGVWRAPGFLVAYAVPRGLVARQRGPKVGDPLGAVYPELPW